MPGGSLLNSGGMGDYGGGGGLTFPVVVTCLMAASGGLIFGYDIGISGRRTRARTCTASTMTRR
uniref:Major facilitator superfamily (MFS) profile domain-containing protein n=1 Tax=Leersia perrieri TaxID=77586 RepID=A0A0D9W5Q1_9ORYZ